MLARHLLNDELMFSAKLAHRRSPAHPDSESAQRALDEAEAEALTEHEKRRALREALYVAGRLIIALVFIGGALAKAQAFDANLAGRLGGLFWASIALQAVAGALLAVGLFTRRAAVALLVWQTVAILFLHGDLAVDVNRIFTLANLGLAGGLMAMVARGGGLLSLDHWLSRTEPKRLSAPVTAGRSA